MDWHILKTEEDYQEALTRMLDIFHTEENTPESRELDLLLLLIKDYEDKHIPLPELDVVEVIKLKMEERGLKARDLEQIIGSKSHISSILSGRREITLKMAKKLRAFFQLPAEVFLPTT